MTDEPTAVSYQGPGQEPGAAPVKPEAQPQGEGTQQTVTLDEVDRRIKEAEDRVLRRAQSYFDKDQNRAEKRVRERLDVLEKQFAVIAQSGVPLTDVEKNRIRLEETRKVLTESESEPATPETPAKAKPGPDDVDPVTAEALEYEKELGLSFDANDPELKLIKVSGKPSEYLSTYREALETKAKRIAAQVNPPVHTPTNLGSGGVRLSVQSQIESLTSKLNDLMKKPSQNMPEITRLRDELEKLQT
jgi:hypothetical protein